MAKCCDPRKVGFLNFSRVSLRVLNGLVRSYSDRSHDMQQALSMTVKLVASHDHAVS